MKSLIFILCLFLGIEAWSQKTPNLFVNYDMNNGDSIVYKDVLNSDIWGMFVKVVDPDDSTGVVSVVVSYDDTLWFLYDSTMSISISNMADTIIGQDTIFYCRFHGDSIDANRIGLKFKQNNSKSGTLSAILTRKEE